MPELKLKNPYHDQVQQDISSGRLIQALKTVREQTGLGLKEAKDLVDGIRGGWAKLTLDEPEVGSGAVILLEQLPSRAEFNQLLDRVEAMEKLIGLR